MACNTEFDGKFAVEDLDRNDDFIKSRIYTVRGVQVMLDRDLAALYGVQTRVLNQAVKRNSARFPVNFMFQLTTVETANLMSQIVTSGQRETAANCSRSQFVILNKGRGGNVKYLPYVFTEQGVAMLSAVLRSPIAVDVSVRVINIFVAMRKALASVAPIITRLEVAERRQIVDQQRNEERFDAIFKARMRPRRRRRVARARSSSREAVARGRDGGDFPPQKVFFEGKHYDAYSFARKLVRKAAKSIVLVDGYCDDVTLDILASKRGGADVTIAAVAKTPITQTAIEKFNKQSPTLTVKTTGVFHDRFLILDGKELYHFGASLKDLGRQYCAVSKMDAMFIPSIMERI